MAEEIIIYMASVSSNLTIKNNLSRAEMIMEAKKIDYVTVDVTPDRAHLEKMREICGDPKATPLQFVKGSTYLGDFSAFEEAVESDTLKEFFKLE